MPTTSWRQTTTVTGRTRVMEAQTTRIRKESLKSTKGEQNEHFIQQATGISRQKFLLLVKVLFSSFLPSFSSNKRRYAQRKLRRRRLHRRNGIAMPYSAQGIMTRWWSHSMRMQMTNIYRNMRRRKMKMLNEWLRPPVESRKKRCRTRRKEGRHHVTAEKFSHPPADDANKRKRQNKIQYSCTAVRETQRGPSERRFYHVVTYAHNNEECGEKP